MIQKNANQYKLSIFDVLAEQSSAPTRTNEDKAPKVDWSGQAEQREPEMKSAWRKRREEEKKAERLSGLEGREDAPAQHLRHNSVDLSDFDPSRSERNIRSARCATGQGISDVGGSSNILKTAGKSSIFNPNAIVDALNAKTSREITAENKEAIAARRLKLDEEYKNLSKPEMQDDDYAFKHRSTIIPAKTASGMKDARSGHIPSNKMSMFDSSDFERLQPTAGEQMKKKESKKDESWKTASKSRSTREVMNDMVDDMVKEADGKNEQLLKNGNPRKNSNDLFDSLIDILNKKSE